MPLAFRTYEGTTLSGLRVWGPSTGTGTMKNRAEPFQLAGDHVLSWRDYSRLRGANGDFRALVLEVG